MRRKIVFVSIFVRLYTFIQSKTKQKIALLFIFNVSLCFCTPVVSMVGVRTPPGVVGLLVNLYHNGKIALICDGFSFILLKLGGGGWRGGQQ